MSDIDVKYAQLGGAAGFLGAPTTAENTAPDGVGRYRHYQGGSVYWSPATGAHEVHGAIRGLWAQLGWERSWLGYPVSNELTTPVWRLRISTKPGSLYADQIRSDPKPPTACSIARASGTTVSSSNVAGMRGGIVSVSERSSRPAGENRSNLSCVARG